MRTALFLEAKPYRGRTVRANVNDASEGRLLVTDVLPNTALFRGVYAKKDSHKLSKLNFKLNPGHSLPAGDRRLDMFLTQPPVRTMQASWNMYSLEHPTAKHEARLIKVNRDTEFWRTRGTPYPLRNDRGLRYRDVINFITSEAVDRLGEDFHIDRRRTFIYSKPGTGIVLPRVPD
ncbi:hypothetical protein AC579_4509 [Pseudocercospora musae]|uniref:Uncharacterized protein n=1 Tax=Pseudocercospora musae TaxID=113226 RepID=A0A139ID90_9PEZI|nr:hypothetical protein AC579_4509 [Pseudocercospora musae]